MDREKRIKLIGATILIGFGVSAAYHYELSVVKGMGYPFNTFLFRPVSQFRDFPNFLAHPEIVCVNRRTLGFFGDFEQATRHLEPHWRSNSDPSLPKGPSSRMVHRLKSQMIASLIQPTYGGG